MTAPPLAVDIDGTLTRPEQHAIDPRVFDPLVSWPAPVVFATGKAFPYPVALAQFIGREEHVVAENGGVVYAAENHRKLVDAERLAAFAEAARAAGMGVDWGGADVINRWRETELALPRDQPVGPVADLAAEHGFELVDSQYAYHIKEPSISKGAGLTVAADFLGLATGEFVAVGDSANDVAMFEVVGEAYAVANATDEAKAAADEVLAEGHAAGAVELFTRLREN